MNEELTNEAAEMIGQYVKGGKDRVFSALIAIGGIIKKTLDTDNKITYYTSPSGSIISYNSAIEKKLKGYKENKENEELTNEAAEMIGQYVKGGKDWVLVRLLECGGVIYKETEPHSGRIPGMEKVFYYYPDGEYACYDPARARAAERHKTYKK